MKSWSKPFSLLLLAGSLVPASHAFTPPADFPAFNILTHDNPESGSLFLAKGGNQGRYLMILDHTGFPEFFRSLQGTGRDFKLQPTGLLTYFERYQGVASHYAMDASYTLVDQWGPSHGQTTLDGHDFQVLPNDHVLLFYKDVQIVDMSVLVPGGHPAAEVTGLVLHELDAAKNLVFEWRSWDHFEITDAVNVNLTAAEIDYVHCNAVELDTDGNLLISSRHLDEITKIDRSTGDVMWRMGGSQNEFTLVGDTQWFTHQHSIRRTASGTLILLDNGNHSTPQESRALEYQVDEVNKIATLVWEFRNTPALYGAALGSVQRLPGGNTLISWGNTGVVTEVRPNGTKAFEMEFAAPNTSTYRALKYLWNGVAAVPTLWADEAQGEATLHFTKFGDDDVAQYHVYRGPAPNPTTLFASTSAETFLLTNLAPLETLYVRVTAEDSLGTESGYSNELEIVMPVWTVSAPEVGAPARPPQLLPGRPNPFVATTRLRWRSEAPARELAIYDVTGRLVRAWTPRPGQSELLWDGTDRHGRAVAGGTYFYRLRTPGGEETRTVTRVR